MTAAAEPTSKDTQAYLPDFCAAGNLFIVVLVTELVAIVLTLAAHEPEGRFLIELSKTSFFVLWFSLLGSAILCLFRAQFESAGKTRAFVLCFFVLELVCVVLAEIAWQVTRVFGQSIIIADSHTAFLLRTLLISSIIIALAMRYLYVSSEWRRSIMLEAHARVSALQALIRPHFLFNSMNTIASLTRSNPVQAEEAVEDLSDLLRATMSTPNDRSSLKQELEIAAIYLRIEKLRLGERLKVRWDIKELPMRSYIPNLTIQPLLENAIYHGIELLPDGGEVLVSGQRKGNELSISISNPVAKGKERKKPGNKMALSNIRERFVLAFGNRSSVAVDDSDKSLHRDSALSAR